MVADRHEEVVDLAVRGVDADVPELERARSGGHLAEEDALLDAGGAGLVGAVDGGIVDGEVRGLAVEVSLELHGIDRALEVRDLQLVDVPRHVRMLAHVKVVHERREADAGDVELADLEREPPGERLHLDVTELGDAVGDVDARERARDDAPADAEIALDGPGEAEARDADPLAFETAGDVGDGRLRGVTELRVDRDPALDVGRAWHAIDHAQRRTRPDVAVESRVVALLLRETDREVTERELDEARVGLRDVAAERGLLGRIEIGGAEGRQAPDDDALRLDARASIDAAEHVLVDGVLGAARSHGGLEHAHHSTACLRDANGDFEGGPTFPVVVGGDVGVDLVADDANAVDVDVDLGLARGDDGERRLDRARRFRGRRQLEAEVLQLAPLHHDAGGRLLDLDLVDDHLAGEEAEDLRACGRAACGEERRAAVARFDAEVPERHAERPDAKIELEARVDSEARDDLARLRGREPARPGGANEEADAHGQQARDREDDAEDARNDASPVAALGAPDGREHRARASVLHPL